MTPALLGLPWADDDGMATPPPQPDDYPGQAAASILEPEVPAGGIDYVTFLNCTTCRTDNGGMERSDGRSGWFSYTNGPGGKDHLAPEVRAKVEQLQAQRGRVLCQVVVTVYEHDAIPSVGFPPGAVYDVETDADTVAAAVNRAGETLATWR